MPLYSANVLRDIYQTEEGERRNVLTQGRLGRQEDRAVERLDMSRSSNKLAKDKFDREGLDMDRKALKSSIDFLANTIGKATPENYKPNFLPLIKTTVGDDVFKKLNLPTEYDQVTIDNLGAMLSGLSTDADKGLLSEKVLKQRLKEYEDKLVIKTRYTKKDKDAKPDLTEAQARQKLFELSKYRQRLNTTGGFDDILFAMIAKENPELAKMLKGADQSEIEAKLKKYETYLIGFTKKGKKRFKYIPGKGFVE